MKIFLLICAVLVCLGLVYLLGRRSSLEYVGDSPWVNTVVVMPSPTPADNFGLRKPDTGK